MSLAEDATPCEVVRWERVDALSRSVCADVRASAFLPEVVVAVARDGWIAGRYVCDLLGIGDLASVKIEHSRGVAEKTGTPTVRYPLADGSVAGKSVLVVDEIASTGRTLRRAEQHVERRDPRAVRTATLQARPNSEVDPDFVGETVDPTTWMVYPWNAFEVLDDLVEGVLARVDGDALPADRIADSLERHHQIDVADVPRVEDLDEVLAEMERRGTVERVGDRWRAAE